MSKKSVGAVLLVIFGIIGCNRDALVLKPSDFELFDRLEGVNRPTKAALKIEQLSSNDVIVAVNGCALTKGTFDSVMEFRYKNLMRRKDMNNMMATKMLDEYRKGYPKMFVTQRLLVDDAFKTGVVTTNEAIEEVAAEILSMAKNKGKSAEAFLKSLGAEKPYFLYECYVNFIMNRLISERIKPLAEVNDDFLKAVRDEVKKNNTTSEKYNNDAKKFLRKCRDDIKSGKMSFAKAASGVDIVYTGNTNDIENAHKWGVFEMSEIDDPTTASVAFAMKTGEISDVIEEDNGFCIIRLEKVFPAEKTDGNTVVANERRELSRIYIEKAPMLIEQSDIALTLDLKRQMQMQAIDRYVGQLVTNGVNRIDHPCGDKLF